MKGGNINAVPLLSLFFLLPVTFIPPTLCCIKAGSRLIALSDRQLDKFVQQIQEGRMASHLKNAERLHVGFCLYTIHVIAIQEKPEPKQDKVGKPKNHIG